MKPKNLFLAAFAIVAVLCMGASLPEFYFRQVSGEINALTAKATPASGDVLVLEDSAASYAKKKITYANLTSGLGGGGTSVYVGSTSVSNPSFQSDQFAINTSTNIALKSAATVTNLVSSGKVTLTDAATVATDASLGNHFKVTITGTPRTLGNPTNGKDGQRCVWEIIQDGTGSRTITMDTKFAFGTDITGITLSTTASKRDFLTAIYDSTADRWHVVGFVRGY